MEQAILQALPNLGVGVASVVVMFLMYKVTISRLKEKDQEFLTEIKEREIAFREYSKSVQEKTMVQLARNTEVLERVFDKLHNK